MSFEFILFDLTPFNFFNDLVFLLLYNPLLNCISALSRQICPDTNCGHTEIISMKHELNLLKALSHYGKLSFSRTAAELRIMVQTSKYLLMQFIVQYYFLGNVIQWK